MDHSLIALAMQAETDNSLWIIIGVILVILFFIVVIIGIGVAVFIVMRKRKKAEQMQAGAAASFPDSGAAAYQPQISEPAPAYEPAPPYESAPAAAMDVSAAEEETRWPSVPDLPSTPDEPDTADFDPSRTVAIVREPTVEISYGKIKFVSGVLAGEEFAVEADGTYIGREPSLSQIVVSDPRISKRHLWIGVRDGAVTVVDQESRNGTFINDPRSERVHEAKLNSGDTVIMGESDVARFEYQG
jgi:Inner membrane component of T3SS, cytoplasmic domain